jgi:NAD(P)-dependent dehydrogenase (short-subunit alcohol dehydrogenase family)
VPAAFASSSAASIDPAAMTPDEARPAGPVRDLAGPAACLVTGASRGIGLALVGELLEHAGVDRVVAVARAATGAPGLDACAARHPGRLLRLDADLTRPEQVRDLAAAVAATVPRLHLVVNAAGVLHGAQLRPEKSITQLRPEALAQVFALNAFAPILLAQALLPLLRHGDPAVFASVSARVGSIGDNRLGGWYAYRASKAAQNQLLRTFAIELARLAPAATCLLLHPGTVDTDLSAPFQATVPPDRLFTPAQSAHRLLAVIAGAGPADSGRFLAYDGSDIPW